MHSIREFGHGSNNCGVVRRVVAAFLVVLTGSPGSAQGLHGTIDGRARTRVGEARQVQDLDGDGTSDLVVLQGLVGGGSGIFASGLLRISGQSLSLIGPPIAGDPAQGYATYYDVMSDYDGDGVQDVIWGLGSPGHSPPSGNATHAEVRSLSTGQSLGVFYNPGNYAYWGWVIAGLGDIDSDGFGDVLVGSDQSRIDLYGGPDGHLIRTHALQNGPHTNAAGVGDVDQDGVPDYAIASAGTNTLWMFSGADGSELWRVQQTFNYHYGYALVAVGDVDGDGASEVAVGAPRTAITTPPDPPQQGFVEIRSGRTGALVRRIDPTFSNSGDFGYWIGAGGDVDGDGTGDVVIASSVLHQGPSGSIRWFCEVHSLREGTLLWRWVDPALFAAGHVRVSIVGDLDGDGDAEWTVAYAGTHFGGPYSGRVWVLDGHFGDAATYCPGSPNSTGQPATLTWLGPLGAGGWEHSLTIDHGPPGSFAQLVAGVASAPTPLGGGNLCVGGPTLERLGAPLALDPTGAVRHDFSSAAFATNANPWTAGAAIGLQAIYRDAGTPGGGFQTTNAWRLVLTP